MNDDILRDALAEIRDLFNHRQAALDPWTSDHYDYDDGYTSGLAQAIAIIEAHLTAQDDKERQS